MKDRTFAIIKPDAVNNGHTGNIYDRIQSGEIPHVRLSTKMIRIPIKAFHKWCGLD